MGDAGISSSSLNTFYDALAFHSNFLRLIADNQRKECRNQPHTSIYGPCAFPSKKHGSVPDVTPFATGPYGGFPGSTDWQVAYPTIARNLLIHHGPGAAGPVLKDLWPSLSLFMTYLDSECDPATGLLLQGARGDWIPPEGNKKGPYITPNDIISAFFHTLSVGYMAEMAGAIGNTADAAKYTARLVSNRKAFHAKFFNNATVANDYATYSAKHATSGAGEAKPKVRCCYGLGSQTANSFALHIGAVPAEHVKDTVDMLVASIYDRNATKPSVNPSSNNLAIDQAHTTTPAADTASTVDTASRPPTPAPVGPGSWSSGAHLDCGIFGTTFVFETLHANGHDAAAVDVLQNRGYVRDALHSHTL
jgi:hypothetical protein